MAEKIRRAKSQSDIETMITQNATESFLNTTEAYQNYLDGASSVKITYYQIADEASRTNTSLEDTHEVVGQNSSLYYYRIKHIPARCASPLDILTQLTQRGLESFINGDLIFTPNTGIIPRSGEFFCYEDSSSPEVEQHLFQITNVNFDKPTNSKYYKIEFKLFNKNTDAIYSHVIKNFIYKADGSGNTDGVGDSVLITEEAAAKQENIDDLVDALIDKYIDNYYDPSMDTFSYQKALNATGTDFEYYWSPYVCNFIYRNDIISSENMDFLTEIWVREYPEQDFPNIYNERGYRKSIYRAAEVKDTSILDKPYDSFMSISAYDLNKPLNLPFFTTASRYRLVEVKHPYNPDFWMGAFNWIYGNEDEIFDEMDGNYKYTGELSTYLIERQFVDYNGNVVDKDKLLGKTFYKLKDANSPFDVTEMWHFDEDGNVFECDLNSIINSKETSDLANVDKLVMIFRDYINNEFTINDDTIKTLEDYYYEPSIRNYLLLPIIIYILQNYNAE